MISQSKILVVDMDLTLLRSTCQLLEQAGYVPLHTSNCENAFKTVQEVQPDLVLLNIDQNKVVGFEVCRRIKTDPALSGIFVMILSSSYIDWESREQGREIGADDYLCLPLPPSELLAHVKFILRLQDAERKVQELSALRQATSDMAANDTIDRTDHFQDEEALRESQAKLQAILDYSPALISIKDLDGNIILANQGFSVLDAPPLNELVGENVFDIFPKEVAEHLWKNDLAALQAKGPIRSEETVRHKDGTWHTYLSVKFPIYLKSDQPFGICAISSDITERKHVEQILRETSEHLTHMLANSPTVIYALKIDGRQANASWISDNIEAVLGCKAEDALRPEWWPDQIHPDDRPHAIERLNHLFDDFFQHEYRFITKGGKVVWLHDEHRLLRDADGNPVEIIGTWTDITERKQVEETLKESEKRFATIFRSNPAAIAITNFQDGKLVEVNETWEMITGYSSAEVIGRSAVDLNLWMNHEQRALLMTEVGEKGKAGCELQMRQKSGEIRDMLMSAELIELSGERFLLTMAQDITEAKKAEKTLREYSDRLEAEVDARTYELREAQEQLIRREKLAVLGQLAGGVGHELRTSLSVITNAAYFLRMIQPEAGEKVTEYIGIIENEIHTAEKIIHDLLDFSRIKLTASEHVIVSRLVQRTLERFPPPKNVAVILNLPEALPTVYIDPHQMVQVLGNLTLNACQAMPEGGTMTISAEHQLDSISICVQDTGEGIPAENMKKLFEPLFTTKTRGIGLGLAVSQKLAEANGGRIEVDSVVDQGSRFTLILPASRKEEPYEQ